MTISRKRKKNSTVVGAEKQTEVGTFGACKKRSRTRKCSSASLPRDMIFNILLRLPASIVHEIMRYVCKEWNDIISDPYFISAHLHHSSSSCRGIIVQDHGRPQRCFYIRTDNATGEKEVSKHEIPFGATILGSCNGLVLLQYKANPRVLHVMNLITKAKLSLPPLAGVFLLETPLTTITFTPCGQYKVVHVSIIPNKQGKVVVYDSVKSLFKDHFHRMGIQIMVCTVGVDKSWRAIIDLKDVMVVSKDVDMWSSLLVGERGVLMDSYGLLSEQFALLAGPLSSAAGYVCWFHHAFRYVLALDVDAEIMYQFGGPKDYVEPAPNHVFAFWVKVETGVSMMQMIKMDGLWTIWKMMEPKSGTWPRGRDVNAMDMRLRLKNLFYPCTIGWSRILLSLENGELWFSTWVDNKCALVCYNQNTQNVWSLPVRWPRRLRLVDVHIHFNSLLPLK